MKLITVDNIYDVVKKTYKNRSFTLRDAINKTAISKKIKPEDIVDQYGSLYTELSQDPRFKVIEGNKWKLTEFMKLNAVQQATDKLYDNEDKQVYEEGYAPTKEENLEGEDIDFDEEFEFFDEEDEDNNEEKQKQLVEDNDYSEIEELEIEKEKEK